MLDQNAKEIFCKAIEHSGDLDSFLDAQCGDDQELRRDVEELVAAHRRAGGFLGGSASASPTQSQDSSLQKPAGTTIGPYKLLQQLGEGGMGVVYLAERQQPVKQRVALKIIKHGMDSKSFIARFEAERQALALMDHPNIAKVLDAGCTDNGRPYLVMELVKGVSISEFCDDNRLMICERLELFIQVCQAVQHAHQKGIIHRDIKPSNVLVAMYDDKPVPKVIDFGVAKATNQQLTERTLFTEVGSILGTWEYMSPEQAVLNQLDVDTRTDVYSLGVLLYELLTGETPLDRKRLREAQIMETLRMIREEEPPKPSTRISELGQRATATAAYRKVKPEALAFEIRGDLDWIVMKALSKERNRRYDSPSRLSDDIGRFLRNDIIEARPPSVWYHVQKAWERHRALLTSVALIMCALLTGLGVACWAIVLQQRAIAERDVARLELQELLQNYQEELTEKGLQYAFSGDLKQVDVVARQLARVNMSLDSDHPSARPAILRSLAEFYGGDSEAAREHIEAALVIEPSNIAARAVLAVICSFGDEFDKYLALTHSLDQELEASPELDDFDRLFIGQVKNISDASKGAEELRLVAKRRKNWAIAQGVLGDILAHEAAVTGNPALKQEALQALEEANRLAPSTPYLVMVDLWVHVVALSLTEEKTEEFRQLQNEARQLSIDLEPYSRFPISRIVRNWFNVNFGDAEDAVASSKEVLATGYYPWAATAFLMQRNDADLDNLLRRYVAHYGTSLIVQKRRFRGEPVAPEMADELIRIMEDPKASTESRFLALGAYALFGKSDISSWARHLESSCHVSDDECFMYKSVAEMYQLEAAGYQDFIRSRCGNNRMKETILSYYAGQACLGRDEPNEALRYFNRAAELKQVNHGCYYFSKAYVEMATK